MSRVFKNAYLLSLLLVLLLSLLGSMFAEGIHRIEAKVDDVVWSWIEDRPEQFERRIVIVEIDENSLNRFGGWPWSREIVARLLAKVREEGAALRLVDIVFPHSTNQDEQLADEIKAMPTVMSQVLAVGADQTLNIGVLQGAVSGLTCPGFFMQSNAVIANAASLKVVHAGHITPFIDEDGVVRRVPAIICKDNHAYPVLSIAGFRLATQANQGMSMVSLAGLWQPPRALNLGEHTLSIPLDKAGNVMMPWYLPRQAMVSVSASDVLDGRVPAGLLKNAWVLVGMTVFGGADTVPTPQSKVASGIEVHMQFLQGVLDQRLPYVPNGADLYTLLVSIFASLLIATYIQCPRLVSRHGVLLFTAVLMSAVFVAHVSLLKQQQLVMPWLLSAGISFATYIMMSARSRLLSIEKANHLYQGLSSYLPEYVAKHVAKEDIIGALTARQENVLILYADLRNFSAWCEQLNPQESGAILHRFYTVASQVISENGGTVEEYVGDAVVGVWRDTDNFASAVQAGQNLIQEMDVLFAMNQDISYLPPLTVGVGIEYGEIIVGSFGPSNRKVHTLLGKSLSGAIKIEAMTQELAYPLIIGEQASRWLVSSVSLNSIGQFFLNNHAQVIELFVPVNDRRA